ncbi:hypothetical protein ABIC37_004450 [Priestia megaterium]|jgi:hypothetical protein|uniref:hypothetical protein n=1 Tax=Priestia megaterium TaxID=1404 RepID=UPI000471A653|nr:hypothetical protein [Priestia megaterium]TCN10773.1 hypothetical protein EV581_104163 [Bacillus sp. BK006]MCM3018624.1 hypothetical protein [Priestia megaterium]MCM3184572.1 hypothetical protein [Priestia megaterium]MCM3195514.1 hypothetical protein [Priestia megaterium]MED3917325.1 hypothetical protein [Priestia megaterium]
MTDNNVGFGVSGGEETRKKSTVSSEAPISNDVQQNQKQDQKQDNYEKLSHQLNSLSDDEFRADRDED